MSDNTNKNKKIKFIAYEGNVMGKAKKMFAAYQEIMKKTELSELDKKLIELLDDNIKNQLLKVIHFL